MSIHQQKKHYDVIVVGGGMAGVCAAIASARHGARTAIVQNRSMFGGNASSEIRMHILGAGCHMAKSNVNETGILMEILLANKARNPAHTFAVWDTVLWEKVRFQDNLDAFLNTNIDDVQVEGGKIRQITGHQNTTETEFLLTADIFIDATGHGTLGVMADAESRMGSEGQAEFQEPNAPAEPNTTTMGNTLMFHAVDRGRPIPFVRPFWAYTFSEDNLKYRHHYNCTTAFADGGTFTEFKPGESDVLPEFSAMDAGYWWIELGGQYADIIAQGEEIRDELLKCVYGVWDHIKNCGDHGAANYELDWVGIVPGYRESRRLVGDYLLNENDVRANRIFTDAVAYGGWPMDEHVRGGILDFDQYPSRIFNFPGIYTIPYRCYCSRNVDNLMMAGRDISTSKMAFGTTRVMATCAIGGQAAGTAAALAIRRQCRPRDIGQHIAELQQILLKDDCYIPGYLNQDAADLARRAAVTASSFVKGSEPTAVVNGVARTDKSGSNCWESDLLGTDGAALDLTWPETQVIREIRLTFDPNLSREIMPSITHTVLERQPRGMPEELVRDFRVDCYNQGKVTHTATITDNTQRLVVLPVPAGTACDSLRITVLQTYGYPRARLFEVRVY